MARRAPRDDGGIEFLSPRAELFGGTAHTSVFEPARVDHEFEPRRPRSLRRTALATLGVCGLAGLLVVAAAPWSTERPAAAPVTTRAASETTPPQPASTPTTASTGISSSGDGRGAPFGGVVTAVPRLDAAASRPAPGFLVDDPPTGFQRVAASDSPDPSPRLPARVMAWANAGATRSSGTWLVVAAEDDGGGGNDIVAGGGVVDLPRGGTGVLGDGGDLTITLHWRPTPTTRAVAVGLGMTQDLFLRYATAAGYFSLRGGSGSPRRGIVDGRGERLDMVVDTHLPSIDVLTDPSGVPSQVATYATLDRRVRFTIVSHAHDPADDLLGELLVADAPDVATAAHSYDLDGGTAVVGVAPENPAITIGRRTVAGRAVTVIGQLTPAQARDVLAGLRQATADEWEQATHTADIATTLSGTRTDPAQRVVIGEGELEGGGGTWTVTLSQDHRELTVLAGTSSLVRHVAAGPDPELLVLASVDATWVIAISSQPMPGAVLQLWRVIGGAAPAPFVTLPDQSWSGAAAAMPPGDDATATVLVDGRAVVTGIGV